MSTPLKQFAMEDIWLILLFKTFQYNKKTVEY